MNMDFWLSNSLTRQFPLSTPQPTRILRLVMARGERISFQICCRPADTDRVTEVSAHVDGPDGISARVRRVGCVPVPHHNTQIPRDALDGVGYIPGYVPDPLFDETTATVSPYETQSFWVTLEAGREMTPGVHQLKASIEVDEERFGMEVLVEISEVVIERRKDFPVTHWFYADAICDWYGLEPWSDEFWAMCDKYMAEFARLGSDLLLTPAFTPPLDGVKRPTQLLKIERDGDGYKFDWSNVDKWVAMAQKHGIDKFEWPHLFTQWGVEHAVRVYEGYGFDEQLLWPADTGATSDVYRNFLVQYLGELKAFLEERGLLEKSYFHISDEPHGPEHLENYRKARAMVRDIAPWVKTMDALSEIEYGRQGLTDFPIPKTSMTKQYCDEGIATWTYYCCWPRDRNVNRFLDTPLANTRGLGWLCYRFRVMGFLQWGFNYWYECQTRNLIDPFTVTNGQRYPNWAYGDTFLVYPGENGPISSIRAEVFAESLQDLALLQTVGADPDAEMLEDLRNFDDFPTYPEWILERRRQLLFPS